MPTKKPAPGADPERVALYEKLVATNTAIERKGATMPYTSVNGNMMSVLSKDGTLAMRLSKDDREKFMAKYKTQPVVMYGANMPEYVDVPLALLKKTAELRKWFDLSYAYTTALRPKPTTKVKKAPAKKA